MATAVCVKIDQHRIQIIVQIARNLPVRTVGGFVRLQFGGLVENASASACLDRARSEIEIGSGVGSVKVTGSSRLHKDVK